MYLAAIIDWHSKAILSYKLSNSMDGTLVTDVLKEALSKYQAPQISMNGKGRSIDNIVIERFFRTLKYNCIFINDYQNIGELKEGINDYISKYNYQRFHSSIGYKKPMNNVVISRI